MSRLKSAALKELLRGSGILLIGKVLGNVAGLGTVAVVAKMLTLEQFGIYAIISTYALIFDKLFNFQNWQLIIKYGADFLQINDEKSFGNLAVYAFRFDCISAIVGLFFGYVTSFFATYIFSFESEHVFALQIYCLTILFRLTGTPTGIIRLSGEFTSITLHTIVFSVARLSVAAILFIANGNLLSLVVSFALVELASSLCLIFIADKTSPGLKFWQPLRKVTFEKLPEGARSFMWHSNFTVGIRNVVKEVDVILLGIFTTNETTGIYKIARSIALVLNKLTDPLYVVIFPMISKMHAKNQSAVLKRFMYTVSVISVACGIVFIFLYIRYGAHAIKFLFGVDYGYAYEISIVYMSGILVWLGLYPFSALLMASGLMARLFYITSVASIIYVITLIPAIVFFQGLGAAGAMVLFYVVWALGIIILYRGRSEKLG